MKKSNLSALALILATLIALPTLAACNIFSTESESTGSSAESTQESSESNSESNSGNNTESSSSTNSDESESEEDTSSTEPAPSIADIKNGVLIENATQLANGIISGFVDSTRAQFEISNQKMSLRYNLHPYLDQQVTSLTSSKGGTYIAHTGDVFVKMADGQVYYASNSTAPATANLYRYGYYYYEARFEEQNFMPDLTNADGFTINLKNTSTSGVKTKYNSDDGSLTATVTSEKDPYIIFSDVSFAAEDYGYIQFVIKTNVASSRGCQLFVRAGESTKWSEGQSKSFTVYPSEEYTTYVLPISAIKDYFGTVSNLRFDLSGNKGDTFEIKEIKVLNVSGSGAPSALGLNRSFLVYSDKMHHFLQVSSADITTEGVAEIGLETKIAKNTVTAIAIKDKNGIHYSLDGIDTASVEYAGFLIEGVGVFGYILPADNSGGTLSVTETGGEYVIIQTRATEEGKVDPSGIKNATTGKIDPVVPLNGNDFFMGQRIYTDEETNLDAFIKEAELERNPLPAECFVIDYENSTNASYVGYDAIRGIYTLKLDSAGFNGPYFYYPNKHYNVKFTINGDSNDRNIYLMASSTSGCLECAVLLDENDMLLPVPVEVGKNFSEAALERNRWNIDDATYGEAIIPMVIKSGSSDTYNFINLYQNWGTVPLKQISWIQASAPCYHLSTGVIETNCITALMATKRARTLNTLPDHRTMSAPLWVDQPQHNSAGSHMWLAYTTAEGVYNATEFTDSVIDSYGPVYADVTNSYISDDGCIKVTYTHTEMPQTDENRAYYEIKYDVLGDISFTDFGSDFSFYSTAPNDPTGQYRKVGYLNAQNECVIAEANKDAENPIEYVLGNDVPYFSFFDMENCTSTSQQGYANLSFLIYNADFTIGGTKCSPSFLLTDYAGTLSLSLDLEKVDLKVGDVITINAIVMPWGSQESVYDSTEFAGDQNVRDVRLNTLKNPLTATADKHCEVIESVYVPKIRTTNGKTAAFTLTGGQNNVAVRVYGFDKLTVPVIEELVDGLWETYVVNSSYSPDIQGNRHFYDGYTVHYDGDGTFSYSFIVPMDASDTDGRSFRVTASKEFTGWPDTFPIVSGDGEELPLNVYADCDDIFNDPAVEKQFDAAELIEDENGNYVRLTPSSIIQESVINYYPGKGTATGQYFVIKYRLPKENTDKLTAFEIYTSTVNDSAKGGDGFGIAPVFKNDGKWHVAIVDLSTWNKESFAANGDGEYVAKYLRVDIFNGFFPTTNRFDLAFIGMSDNLDDIYALSEGMKVVQFATQASDGSVSVKHIDPATGEFVDEPIENAVDKVDGYTVHLDAEELIAASKTNGSEHRGTTELPDDKSYVRFNICTDESKHEAYRKESYVFVHKPKASDVVGTGQYIVIKYRAERQIGSFQIYASTETTAPSNDNRIQLTAANGTFVGDGEWHTLIVDISTILPEAFKTNADGIYCTQMVRFDMFNLDKPLESGDSTYVDIAYIGFTTDYSAIDLPDGASLYNGSTITEIPSAE